MLLGRCPSCGFVLSNVSDQTIQAALDDAFRAGSVIGAIAELVSQSLQEAQRREQCGKDAT